MESVANASALEFKLASLLVVHACCDTLKDEVMTWAAAVDAVYPGYAAYPMVNVTLRLVKKVGGNYEHVGPTEILTGHTPEMDLTFWEPPLPNPQSPI